MVTLHCYAPLSLLSAGILFEMCEVSFQHHLPNFIECWWDHVIVDVLLCNALGIALGMATVRWLHMKEYHWVTWDWTRDTPLWPSFHLLVVILGPALLCDLNIFYLKYLLWVFPSHWLCSVRLAIMFLMGCGAAREQHDRFVDRSVGSLGSFNRIMASMLFLEF